MDSKIKNKKTNNEYLKQNKVNNINFIRRTTATTNRLFCVK